MLRIAKLTDYATLLMVHLARDPSRSFSTVKLADELRLPTPTVAKLMKRLVRAQLLQSARGSTGGYRLAHDPCAISVADVVSAIEGPVALTECARATGDCALEQDCATRANWQLISRSVWVALDAISLADMAKPHVDLKPVKRMQEKIR